MTVHIAVQLPFSISQDRFENLQQSLKSIAKNSMQRDISLVFGLWGHGEAIEMLEYFENTAALRYPAISYNPIEKPIPSKELFRRISRHLQDTVIGLATPESLCRRANSRMTFVGDYGQPMNPSVYVISETSGIRNANSIPQERYLPHLLSHLGSDDMATWPCIRSGPSAIRRLDPEECSSWFDHTEPILTPWYDIILLRRDR